MRLDVATLSVDLRLHEAEPRVVRGGDDLSEPERGLWEELLPQHPYARQVVLGPVTASRMTDHVELRTFSRSRLSRSSCGPTAWCSRPARSSSEVPACSRAEAAGHAERCTALSVRQGEVVRLVARGLINDQIATRLGISARTVRKHVEDALSRTGCSSRAAVARWWGGGGASATLSRRWPAASLVGPGPVDQGSQADAQSRVRAG